MKCALRARRGSAGTTLGSAVCWTSTAKPVHQAQDGVTFGDKLDEF
mgnify:CR=1 FL=1